MLSVQKYRAFLSNRCTSWPLHTLCRGIPKSGIRSLRNDSLSSPCSQTQPARAATYFWVLRITAFALILHSPKHKSIALGPPAGQAEALPQDTAPLPCLFSCFEITPPHKTPPFSLPSLTPPALKQDPILTLLTVYLYHTNNS